MEAIDTVFYGMVLPNSAAGALFVLVILLFRKMTRRMSKGYVRMLWVLFLTGLLAPPLFHVSFDTPRDWAARIRIQNILEEWQETQPDMQERLQQSINPDTVGQQLQESNDAGMGQMSSGGQQDGKESAALPPEPFVKDAPNAGGQETDTAKVRVEAYDPHRSGQDGSGQDRSSGLDKWKRFAAVVWCVGVVVCAAIFAGQLVRLKKRVADAAEVKLTGEQETGFWVTKRIDTPFVMPGLPSKIYLPEGLSKLQQQDILAHERQHMKNKDPLLRCLALLAAAVHWFNPMIWAAYWLMGKDMEMYCDETVLRGKDFESRRQYSNTLLEFASLSSGLDASLRFGRSDTEQRICHILYNKRPNTAVRLLLGALVCVSGICFLTANQVKAGTEEAKLAERPYEGETHQAETHEAQTYEEKTKEQLAESIRAAASGSVLRQYYADFDADGAMEMFALTGKEVAKGTNEIWFASQKETVCLMEAEEGLNVDQSEQGVYEVNDRQKLFAVRCITMGRYATSKCYYVQAGQAQEVSVGAQLEQISGESFAVYPPADDCMMENGRYSGRTCKPYGIKWTGTGFEEYPVKKLTLDELSEYSGAKRVLEQIQECGYQISQIYYRSNGLIQINVQKPLQEENSFIYENVTLNVVNGEVSVAEHFKDGQDLVEKSTYGGSYQASVWEEPALADASKNRTMSQELFVPGTVMSGGTRAGKMVPTYTQNGFYCDSYLIEMGWNLRVGERALGVTYADKRKIRLKNGSDLTVYFHKNAEYFIQDKKALAAIAKLVDTLTRQGAEPKVEEPVVYRMVRIKPKEIPAYAEKYLEEEDNIGISALFTHLSLKKQKEYLKRIYEIKNTAIFAAIVEDLDNEMLQSVMDQARADKNSAFSVIAMDVAQPELIWKYAKEAYEQDDIADFCIILDYMTKKQKQNWLKRARADKKSAFEQVILLG